MVFGDPPVSFPVTSGPPEEQRQGKAPVGGGRVGQEPPCTQAAARSWAVSRTQDPVGWELGFVASLRLGSESREQKEEEEGEERASPGGNND